MSQFYSSSSSHYPATPDMIEDQPTNRLAIPPTHHTPHTPHAPHASYNPYTPPYIATMTPQPWQTRPLAETPPGQLPIAQG
ncbi:MAG: hypothetical protein M3Z24_08660, partial [Chloroflexota bacterium]|nr:hypothetical protein [Chloroflexota bacterium]